MPIITKELVDALVPEHDRTSCSDDNVTNGYGGWSGEYSKKTGQKIVYYPRCNRCYLLDHIGEDMSKLQFKIVITLAERS